MAHPESARPNPEAASNSTDYEALFHSALNPGVDRSVAAREAETSAANHHKKFVDALNPLDTLPELARESAGHEFLPGESVTYFTHDGEEVKAQVATVDNVLNTSDHRHEQFVTLHYPDHANADPTYGPTIREVRLSADKLAQMQVTKEKIEAARPQHDIESILGGAE